MKDVQVFTNDKFGNVRVIKEDNNLMFVARDVAEALGYVWNGISRIYHVPAEWRSFRQVVTAKGYKDVAVLLEQGLYFFLARSDKPNAIQYQKWIAGEVMPSIRKTGSYSVCNDIVQHHADGDTPNFSDIESVCAAWGKERALRQRAEFLLSKYRTDDSRLISDNNKYKELLSIAEKRIRELEAMNSTCTRQALLEAPPNVENYMSVEDIPWLYEIFYDSPRMHKNVCSYIKRYSRSKRVPVKKVRMKYSPIERYEFRSDIIHEFLQDLKAAPKFFSEFRRDINKA